MSSSLVSFDLDFLKKGDLQIHEMSGDLCLLFQSLGCISCDVSKIAFLCLSLYFSASSVSFFPFHPLYSCWQKCLNIIYLKLPQNHLSLQLLSVS